jgi:hypothetical protein
LHCFLDALTGIAIIPSPGPITTGVATTLVELFAFHAEASEQTSMWS